MRKLPEVQDHEDPSSAVLSFGDIFPAVISVTEVYDAPISWEEFLRRNPQLVHFDQNAHVYAKFLEKFFSRPLEERVISRLYVLSLPSWIDTTFASYNEAHAEALKRLHR